MCGAFERCSLIGVHWSDLMPVGKISEPIREMTGSLLKYNTFSNLNFTKFRFAENMIQESTFDQCRLQESDFSGARLEATQFLRCDLRNADFREAVGYQVDIETNRLKGARFSFPEVVNLLASLGIHIE